MIYNKFVFRLSTTLVFSVLFMGFLFCQEPDKKDDGFFIESTEQASPFEVPSDSKFSQETQTRYADLMSRLYNDRNIANQELSKSKKAKQNELAKTSPKNLELLNKLTQDIEKLDKNHVSIQNDIEKLNNTFKKSSSDKEAIKVIELIEKERYNIVNSVSAESNEAWESEFDYLKKVEKEDVRKNVIDCNIAFNGIDPSSLEKKIQTGSEKLIEYTHPKLEEHYKDASFLTGDVSMIEVGGNRFMTLNITIRSRDAVKNYGMIQTGTPLKIELINGDSAYLFAAIDAVGRPIAKTNNINYQALYTINKSEYKLLKKSEIDNVGIMWSSGYEKYDVYNIDVVQKQLTCLENF